MGSPDGMECGGWRAIHHEIAFIKAEKRKKKALS
jgi:hypothetical protein